MSYHTFKFYKVSPMPNSLIDLILKESQQNKQNPIHNHNRDSVYAMALAKSILNSTYGVINKSGDKAQTEPSKTFSDIDIHRAETRAKETLNSLHDLMIKEATKNPKETAPASEKPDDNKESLIDFLSEILRDDKDPEKRTDDKANVRKSFMQETVDAMTKEAMNSNRTNKPRYKVTPVLIKSEKNNTHDCEGFHYNNATDIITEGYSHILSTMDYMVWLINKLFISVDSCNFSTNNYMVLNASIRGITFNEFSSTREIVNKINETINRVMNNVDNMHTFYKNASEYIRKNEPYNSKAIEMDYVNLITQAFTKFEEIRNYPSTRSKRKNDASISALEECSNVMHKYSRLIDVFDMITDTL